MTTRMRELIEDFERYALQLTHDEEWRKEMQRTVVIEMRVEVERLWEECQ